MKKPHSKITRVIAKVWKTVWLIEVGYQLGFNQTFEYKGSKKMKRAVIWPELCEQIFFWIFVNQLFYFIIKCLGYNNYMAFLSFTYISYVVAATWWHHLQLSAKFLPFTVRWQEHNNYERSEFSDPHQRCIRTCATLRCSQVLFSVLPVMENPISWRYMIYMDSESAMKLKQNQMGPTAQM